MHKTVLMDLSASLLYEINYREQLDKKIHKIKPAHARITAKYNIYFYFPPDAVHAVSYVNKWTDVL